MLGLRCLRDLGGAASFCENAPLQIQAGTVFFFGVDEIIKLQKCFLLFNSPVVKNININLLKEIMVHVVLK